MLAQCSGYSGAVTDRPEAMRPRPFHISLILLTALLVIAIAVLAGGSLWVLRSVYHRSARSVAARSVLDLGRQVAAHLAAHPSVHDDRPESEDWRQFSELARALHSVEDGLQYVSVSADGVTVFHEQMNLISDAGPTPDVQPPAIDPDTVSVGRSLLTAGDAALPVITFTAAFTGKDGDHRSVQIGMRKDAVERQERGPATAIATMFRLALATIIVAFCICTLVVIWMMYREVRGEEKRRKEEHLAFAGIMANGIAHDFRNPMSSLKLDVQMLKKETDKGTDCRRERVAELAGRVESTIERMDRIFREFSFLSRPSTAKHEPISLRPCIEDCADLLKTRFEAAGVTLDIDLPDDDIWISGSSADIKRALLNVLANAQQFSPRGGTVTLCCTTGRHAVRIEVLDEGPGIPEHGSERVFEMFTSARPGGTGLGLALAKTGVEHCNGRISAANRPEGGASFTMVIPTIGDRSPNS
jgi:signal transduction histidine kinase